MARQGDDGVPGRLTVLYSGSTLGAFSAEHVAKTLDSSVEYIRITNTSASAEGGGASPLGGGTNRSGGHLNAEQLWIITYAASFGSLA